LPPVVRSGDVAGAVGQRDGPILLNELAPVILEPLTGCKVRDSD
jgi:hypothetical protein